MYRDHAGGEQRNHRNGLAVASLLCLLSPEFHEVERQTEFVLLILWVEQKDAAVDLYQEIAIVGLIGGNPVSRRKEEAYNFLFSPYGGSGDHRVAQIGAVNIEGLPPTFHGDGAVPSYATPGKQREIP